MTRSRTDTVSASVEINGAEMYYQLAGAGQPLVLIHAGIADHRMWDAQFSAFAERFRTVRYDLRGVGLSSMPAGPFSHHNDLKGLLEALDIDQAHLVGPRRRR